MKTISICIPTYEMGGRGAEFLKQSFDVLCAQSFKDFEVVISDHSLNDAIKDLCSEYSEKILIRYYRNAEQRGNSSANLNNAIVKAEGELIKILFQDDLLRHDKALEEIAGNFDLQKDKWLVTACTHSIDGVNFFRDFYPRYNKNIYLGVNTISSPSVLAIKNEKPLLFDENLIWLMDCDYYKRCYDSFGEPKILNDVNVVNRTGKHQVSKSIVDIFVKIKELVYIMKKYIKL